MKVLRILAALVVVILVVLGVALFLTRPDPLPIGTQSASRLMPGPYAVDLVELVWIDETRSTDSNGAYPGAPTRTFKVALWSPIDAPGPHPLVVFSHGFMSNRYGGTYLGEDLASHGYVVVSADFPLTHFGAPGGPNANDVVHQPADVSFLIDKTFALEPDERRFSGGIDRQKIGVMGISLGALTTTLVAYHPRFGDPRIRAAVSIAGPSVLFGKKFFDFADVPFLMIAGTHDAMIPFEENAVPIPEKIHDGGLLTIESASHAGFSYLTSGPLRLLGNPDEIGCRSLMANLDIEEESNPFPGLGGSEDGIVDARGASPPCEIRFEEAMSPGRQQWFTMLAVRAFFESRFAKDPSARASHLRFLTQTFPAENPEITYTKPHPQR